MHRLGIEAPATPQGEHLDRRHVRGLLFGIGHGHGKDPCEPGDFFACEPVWITPSIKLLVMSADDPTYVLQVRRKIDQLLTEDWVLLDDGLLGRTECLRVLHPLVDESAGGSHQPDVVEPSSQLERLAVGCGELQEVGHRSAQSEDSAGLGA